MTSCATSCGPAMAPITKRPPVEQVQAKLLAAWTLALRYPMEFLRRFVVTADQHDKLHPIKPFPAKRPWVRPLVELWRDNPLIVEVKSRQMLQTWFWVSLMLWEALHPGRLVILQSKREDDAIGDRVAGDGLLGRALFILDHLPGAALLCPEGQAWRVREGNRIQFPLWGSTIWAIPQGGSVIRQRTCSAILADEAAYQEEFEEAYTAALPTIRGGGSFVALSTAHPGFFQRVYEDRIDQP